MSHYEFPQWAAPEKVEEHTEHAVLISNNSKVFDRELDYLTGKLKEYYESDSLTIRGVPDGLERLELDKKEPIYINSVWIIDYDIIKPNIKEDGGQERTTIEKKLDDELKSKLFPSVVQPRILVEGGIEKPISEIKHSICKEYQIHPCFVITTYEHLEADLGRYFWSIDPEIGFAAKQKIYNWSELVRKLAL